MRFMMGKMMFSAIKLVPSESVYASSIPGFIPTEGGDAHRPISGWAQQPYGVPDSSRSLAYQQPILLWGLTLGVLADLLDQLPPYNAVALWKYPNFTVPDLRLLVYLCTRSTRKNTADIGAYSSGSWPNPTAMDATSQAEPVVTPPPLTETEPMKVADENMERHRVGIGGLGVGSDPRHAVGRLMKGYYDRVNVAIVIFLAYRTIATTGLVIWLYKFLKNRRKARL
jgi:hypothetical protein